MPGKRKYLVNDYFFTHPNILNSYWAGFIAADGCVYHREHCQSTLTIKLSSKDYDQLEYFINDINYTGNIKVFTCKNDSKNLEFKSKFSEKCLISIRSSKMCEDLQNNYNIIPRKSLILRAPNKLHIDYAIAFIIGYIDGDGCISHNYDFPSLSMLGTQDVLCWIKNTFLNAFNMKGNLGVHKVKKLHKLTLYCIHDIVQIYEYIKINQIRNMARKWDIVGNFIKESPDKLNFNKNSKRIEFGNKIQSLAEWAKEMDIPLKTLWNRIHTYKWSMEKALTTPLRRWPDI